LPVRPVNFRRSALTSLFCSLKLERRVFLKVRFEEVLVMSTDQLRNRTVGSKMTESEYEQLVAVAERDGVTLGEWCREVLLARANANVGKNPSTPEQILLAEVMALRTILLNALFKLAQGAVLTTEELDRLIERADGERFERAQERFAEVPTGGRS